METQERTARLTSNLPGRMQLSRAHKVGRERRRLETDDLTLQRQAESEHWPFPDLSYKPGSEGEATIARLAAEAVLEKLHRGVMIVDRAARLRFVNGAAQSMLDRHDGFRITSDGCLLLMARAAQCRFALYLHVSRICVGESLTLRLEREGQAGPYRVLVAPLEKAGLRGLLNGAGPLHVVLVYEPHAGRNVPRRILRQVYGLTAAEAVVASSLFHGRTMNECARDLAVSIHTVRTHLRHIFDKCQVDSQAELMQLLALGPRTL